jgi:hypothetical protein
VTSVLVIRSFIIVFFFFFFQCYGVKCELTAGKYSLIPFTTGCRLQPSLHEPAREAKLVATDRDGKVKLAKSFV